MIYCDSSFLVAGYLPTESFHGLARKEMGGFSEEIAYTLLNELEVTMMLQRGVGTGRIDFSDRDAVLRDLADDEADGVLARTSLNQVKVHERAMELSRKFTATLGCRALDILHVAAALALGAKVFASFDHRQRKLAAAAGLKVLPKAFPK